MTPPTTLTIVKCSLVPESYHLYKPLLLKMFDRIGGVMTPPYENTAR